MRIVFKVIAITALLSFLGGFKNGVFFIFGLIVAGIFGYFGWRPEKTIEKENSSSPTEPPNNIAETTVFNNLKSSKNYSEINYNNDLSETDFLKQIESSNQKKELLIRSYNDGLFNSQEYHQKKAELEAEISKLSQLLNLKRLTRNVLDENKELFNRLLELKEKALITNDEYKFKYNELITSLLQTTKSQNKGLENNRNQSVNNSNKLNSEEISNPKIKIYYLLGFTLILFLTVIILVFQYSSTKSYQHPSYYISNSKVSNSKTIDHIPNEKLIQKLDSAKNTINDNNISNSKIEVKNTIVLFDNVNEIYPGETSFNEVKAIMGEPDFIEQTKIKVVNGEMTGRHKLVKYHKKGIELIFANNDVNMSAVDAITVNKGFDGVSEEGIYIGMAKEKCLAILNEKYFLDMDLEECMLFSEKEGGNGDLQIWFKKGKLDKLKFFRKT